MIDGVPHRQDWDEMSVRDVQVWAHSLRAWKQAMRQDTPASRAMRQRVQREKRRLEASGATVDLEDYQ